MINLRESEIEIGDDIKFKIYHDIVKGFEKVCEWWLNSTHDQTSLSLAIYIRDLGFNAMSEEEFSRIPESSKIYTN